MATTIGKLAMILSADATEFDKTLVKAESQARQWSKTVASAVSDPFNAGRAAMLSFGGGIGRMATLGLDALTKVDDFFTSQAKEARTTSRLAQRFGTDTATMKAFEVMASDRVEPLIKALEVMNRKIGEAAIKGGEADKIFKALGLSLKELATVDLASRFNLITAALARATPDVAAAGRRFFFDKGGGEIADLMDPDKLQRAMGQVARHGLAPNDEMIGRFKEISLAARESELRVQGLNKRLAEAWAGPWAALKTVGIGIGSAATKLGDPFGVATRSPAIPKRWRGAEADFYEKDIKTSEVAKGAQKDLAMAIDDVTKTLVKQNAEFGLSATAIKRMNLEAQGASQAMLKTFDVQVAIQEADKESLAFRNQQAADRLNTAKILAQENFGRDFRREAETLVGPAMAPTPGLVAGSAAARSFEVAAQGAGARENRVVEEMQRLREIAEKEFQALGDLRIEVQRQTDILRERLRTPAVAVIGGGP